MSSNLDEPYYSTTLGKAYLGDSIEVMRALPDGSINWPRLERTLDRAHQSSS